MFGLTLVISMKMSQSLIIYDNEHEVLLSYMAMTMHKPWVLGGPAKTERTPLNALEWRCHKSIQCCNSSSILWCMHILPLFDEGIFYKLIMNMFFFQFRSLTESLLAWNKVYVSAKICDKVRIVKKVISLTKNGPPFLILSKIEKKRWGMSLKRSLVW